MINVLKTAVAIAAIWIAYAVTRVPPHVPGRTTEHPTTRPARTHVDSSAAGYQGMAVQLYTGEDVWGRWSRLMPEIADLGANTVMMIVHAYQDHAGSMNLRLHGEKTPTPANLGRLIDHARAQGLRVILMPIILLEYPRGNEWRGKIKPPDLETWWGKYVEFIVHFAKVAASHDVEVYMVGSELVGLESSTARWRKLITDVKQVYPGKLGYSANWDHYRPIEFWDQLDIVGMTSYYQLSDHERPDEETVVNAWGPIKKDILEFQAEVKKPILFTEVGWCSQEGASVEAWNYYHKQNATPEGRAEQATLYTGFMKAWEGTPGVGGCIWWEWTNDEGGDKDYNYTPRGKPAEKLLRDWFARQTTAAASQAATQSTATPAGRARASSGPVTRVGDLMNAAAPATAPR